MKNTLIKLFMDFNVFLIRISRGRIGSKLGTQTILLLETTGRKTGQPRVIPIAYFFHEGKYLIVESNWGKDKDADWYLNLLKTPRAKLTVNGKKRFPWKPTPHRKTSTPACGNLPPSGIRLI